MENIDTKLLEIWYHNPTIVFNWFKLCNLKHKQRTVTFYTSVCFRKLLQHVIMISLLSY